MTDWDGLLTGTAPDIDEAQGPPPEAGPVIKQLAQLSTVAYDQCRKEEADRLGIRVATLDQAVASLRDATADSDDNVEVVENIEPWHDPVPGGEIAEVIRVELLRYVVFPSDHDADAAALWCLGSYLMDVWRLWPKLLIGSPQKRCGKSTLLEVLEGCACRALVASSLTGPVIFRVVEEYAPALLIDEADRFMRDNEAMIGIINSGHTRRTARAFRVVETKVGHEVRAFSTWSPMVIAGIGSQADTIVDRSIRINLERKLPTERAAKLPPDFFERTRNLRRKLMRWAADNGTRIAALEIEPPPCGNDRAQDNWTPLYRIATHLGEPWSERVGAAYLAKEASDANHDESVGEMLLADVMAIFRQRHADQVETIDIVTDLLELDDRPWREWKRGKPMSDVSLARLLKPFGIRSRNIRAGGRVRKGYLRAPVEAAWQRYCNATSPDRPATPLQSNNINSLDENRAATIATNVAGQNGSKSLKLSNCSGVAVQTEVSGAIERLMADHAAMDDPLNPDAWQT